MKMLSYDADALCRLWKLDSAVINLFNLLSIEFDFRASECNGNKAEIPHMRYHEIYYCKFDQKDIFLRMLFVLVIFYVFEI